MKKILIRIRTSIKLLIIISVATLLIMGIVALVYKPIYSVSINGEIVGYCREKRKLQTKIDNLMEHGEEGTQNVAFVEIEEMPKYELCLLKRGITTNDDEIYEAIKESSTTYYKYYAILEDNEEKLYVSDFTVAEEVVQGLKDKDSENIDNIQILEKYETELKDFVSSEDAVASLYKQKVVKKVTVAKKTTRTQSASYSTSANSSGFSTSSTITQSAGSLGISLIKPVTGTISSRFGARSRVRSSVHTGLDIATSNGTPIKAAASGTVTFAGYKGSYGNLLVITHSNGVQTYYGHCSKLYASSGQTVSQGEVIAAVGSTGNSTGPHLHFEIRVNGVACNPQNYVY